jgi:hypothetical protein
MNSLEKRWQKIYSYWESFNVPEVTTIKFDYEKYFCDVPWYSIEVKRQVVHENSPVKDTAYHLAVCLKNKNPKLIAVYKIYAFLRNYGLSNLLTDILVFAFKKDDEEINGWWSYNAKYLLPDVDFYASDYGLHKNMSDKDWKKIVEVSAQLWKLLAEKWCIIMIPKFLDINSVDYKIYNELSEKKFEEKEFQEYLRLKEKYEK